MTHCKRCPREVEYPATVCASCYNAGDYYDDCRKDADRIRQEIRDTHPGDHKRLSQLAKDLERALYTGD